MKHHFATGLGLLESRRRGQPLHRDRRSFGPILDLPQTPLPADLAEWLDGHREHGVVYVAFGTMVALSPRRLQMLLSAFGAFDAPVLWAVDGGRDALPTRSLPTNLRVESFVPQRSVLSHQAVGGCVTHGGIGTVLECIAAGTPLVVMPVLWDQPYNAQFVHELGAGIRLDWWNLRERALVDALTSILRSPEYRHRVSLLAHELRAQRGAEDVLHFLEHLVTAKASQ
jgi:MGT family glycosyltransferase